MRVPRHVTVKHIYDWHMDPANDGDPKWARNFVKSSVETEWITKEQGAEITGDGVQMRLKL